MLIHIWTLLNLVNQKANVQYCYSWEDERCLYPAWYAQLMMAEHKVGDVQFSNN